jgi:RNA polymerase sigma-70 factor (ECF subfamily)
MQGERQKKHGLRLATDARQLAQPAEGEAAPLPLAEPAFDRMSPLVEAARRGDPRAVEEVLGLLSQPLLRAVCALLGRDHPDVDDLVQDVLIDVAHALPSFRGECTLLHFAIRIAARKASTTQRRSVAVRGWLERFQATEEPVREAPRSPREEALSSSRRRLLGELLGELPETQAETMVLRALLGYSLEETATITRVPVNTVRSRLRLAKETLRRRLASDLSALELLEDA